MKLLIINPEQQESHIVEWVEVYTPHGSMIIKAGHAPMITSLIFSKNIVFLLKTGELKTIFLERPGFLEINRTVVTVIIN